MLENLCDVLSFMQKQACISSNELSKYFEGMQVTLSAYDSWKTGAYVPNQKKLSCVTNLFTTEAAKYGRDISKYVTLAEQMRREKRV